jgi:hypothetical protein
MDADLRMEEILNGDNRVHKRTDLKLDKLVIHLPRPLASGSAQTSEPQPKRERLRATQL